MAKIGGIWFLLLGIVMVGFSLFVQSKNGSAKMSLFIFVGAVFIMIGTFKLVKSMILKDVNLPPQRFTQRQNNTNNLTNNLEYIRQMQQNRVINNQRSPRQNNQQNFQQNNQQNIQVNSSQRVPAMIKCSRCGSRNYITNPSCAYCGFKFR